MQRKLITRKDAAVLLIVAAVILISLIVGEYTAQNGVYAEVTVDGKTVETISLSDKSYSLYTLENGVVIEKKDGTVRFYESDCKDKICINSGTLSRAGDVAACLPNKTVIALKGEKTDYDIMTY